MTVQSTLTGTEALVNELRYHERNFQSLIHGPLCGQAADEIERLGGAAQPPLPSLVDRSELIKLLEDLASVNLSREAVERQARRMADDLIARGIGGNAYPPSDAFIHGVREALIEKCAHIADDHTPAKHDGTLAAHVTGSTIAKAIRALALPSTQDRCPHSILRSLCSVCSVSSTHHQDVAK